MPLLPLTISPQDIERIRRGDDNVLATALQSIIQNLNQQVVQLGQRVGKWHAEAWAAANYTSALAGSPPTPGTNWTVEAADQLTLQYLRLDDLLIVEFALTATAIGAAAEEYLCIRIPGGYYASTVLCTGVAHARYDAGGPSTTKLLPVLAGRGASNLYLPDQLLLPFDAGAGFTTWPTNRTLDLRGSIALQISSPAGSTSTLVSQ